MNKKMMLGAVLGLAVLGASTAASAHVDVAVGLGVPVQPVYAAPAPVAYGYSPGYNPYWREHREWREREWRRHEWREHQWHERHGWR